MKITVRYGVSRVTIFLKKRTLARFKRENWENNMYRKICHIKRLLSSKQPVNIYRGYEYELDKDELMFLIYLIEYCCNKRTRYYEEAWKDYRKQLAEAVLGLKQHYWYREAIKILCTG